MDKSKDINTYNLAEKIQKWLSKQKYGEDNILHPAVCCDYVGKVHFIKAIKELIDNYFDGKEENV